MDSTTPTISGVPGLSGKASKQQAQVMEQKAAIMARFLTQEANQRLSRVALVNPTKAAKVESVILQQAQQGRVSPGSVDDGHIKRLLEQVSQAGRLTGGLVIGERIADMGLKGDGSIVISRRSMIDDMDDDSDEDLSF
eukprot:gnl/Dysnectes_brevis/3388_a4262_1464.p1 GENE.gnl/Dysnectes_brevis/3388_a4262_1464~~gnl/Dysnectes_brevis/3388_a4262_1464.p1  ORF type:complete len:138 (+),score=48.24 gnl/Dysnectes_brevis/3388_a4262_1464:43-456(+)